jgi:DNA-binding NtrC family response regulator
LKSSSGSAFQGRELNQTAPWRDVERRMIADALRKHNGNISRAGAKSGWPVAFYLKLERYHLSASA